MRMRLPGLGHSGISGTLVQRPQLWDVWSHPFGSIFTFGFFGSGLSDLGPLGPLDLAAAVILDSWFTHSHTFLGKPKNSSNWKLPRL